MANDTMVTAEGTGNDTANGEMGTGAYTTDRGDSRSSAKRLSHSDVCRRTRTGGQQRHTMRLYAINRG